ncbi:hypothetical protein [Streptomyces phaeofaciens]|uniref:hypothetical protein n=1 Tax=Streptomyces phaeofaciens TaxID=68254 RepID=UPI00167A8C2D|nr:hypothetical protein [Streptomyces phaeofaciens]
MGEFHGSQGRLPGTSDGDPATTFPPRPGIQPAYQTDPGRGAHQQAAEKGHDPGERTGLGAIVEPLEAAHRHTWDRERPTTPTRGNHFSGAAPGPMGGTSQRSVMHLLIARMAHQTHECVGRLRSPA